MNPGKDRVAIAGRLLLGAAAGVALYLASMALGRTALPGCGAASDCQDVMQSRWAYAFGIPVSFFGFVLYSITVMQSWAFVRRERSVAGLAGGMATSAVLAGAVWFTALQIFDLKTICFWCCVTHGCAVTGAALLWRSRLRNPLPDLDCSNDLRDASSPLSNDRVFRFTATGAALTGVGLLALGSLSGPLRARHAREEARSTPAVARSSGGTLALLDGQFTIHPDDYPSFGSSAGNARTAVLLSDYTCEWCRTWHGTLEKAIASANPPVRIIMLPAARTPAAREIQQSILTVFHHSPAAWRSLSTLIAAGQIAPEPDAVGRAALSLIGQEKFAAAALAHAEKISAQLEIAANFLNEGSKGEASMMLPRLYSGSRVLTGAESSPAAILAFLDNTAPQQTLPEPKPILTLLNEAVNLDELPAGQTREFQIKIRNTGTASLEMGWLLLDEGCEVTSMPAGKVFPGDVAAIGLRLTAPEAEGEFTRRLQLHSDSPGEAPFVTVRGRAGSRVALESSKPAR